VAKPAAATARMNLPTYALVPARHAAALPRLRLIRSCGIWAYGVS
jgi:hypothetical protein